MAPKNDPQATRAAIEDCVVSNVRGAGMVSEVGNETGQWAYNVVTGVRGDGDSAFKAMRAHLATVEHAFGDYLAEEGREAKALAGGGRR